MLLRFDKLALLSEEFAPVVVCSTVRAASCRIVVILFLCPVLGRHDSHLGFWDKQAVGDVNLVLVSLIVFNVTPDCTNA